MAISAANLRAILKMQLNNDATLTDPDDYNNFLTWGQEMIVQDSPHTLGIKEGSISVTQNTRTYSLATDVYQVKAVFYASNGYRLPPIPISEFVDTVERLPTIPSGAPTAYCIEGYDEGTPDAWQISFDRIPDTSYTYKYWYWWMPAAVSGTALPAISGIGFGRLMIAAAMVIACERGNRQGYDSAIKTYERMLRAYRSFNVQGPDRIPILNPLDYTRRIGNNELGPSYPIEY